jgi:hypothetical protein
MVGLDVARRQYCFASTVATNADGRLELLAVGTDAQGWYTSQLMPGGGWDLWRPLGGYIYGSPTAIQNTDGRLEIFALGGGNTVYENRQIAPGREWYGWIPMGGSIVSTPTAAVNNDGRLEIFAEGTDGGAWHAWQQTPGSGWTGWSSMGGGIFGSPSADLNGATGLEIFALGGGYAPYYNAQATAGGAWSGWISLGGAITGAPSVGMNFDGRLEIFGLGGVIYHNWQLSPGGAWSGWTPLTQASNKGDANGADLPYFLTETQNDSNFAAAGAACHQPPWLTVASAWPCGARVNIAIVGYNKKSQKAFKKAVDNWNQGLFSYYSTKYAQVPVQLYISGGGPQSVRVYRVGDNSIPGSRPLTYGRARNANQQADINARLLSLDIQIIQGMTYPQTLTNTFAHELGHTFGLFDCDQCGPTVMDSYEPAPNGHGWDYVGKNFTEGLPGPTVCDLQVVDTHLTDYAYCGMVESAPPADVPTCTNGAAVGFIDNGQSSHYSCGGVACDGCNSSCSNFAPQNCSGGGGGGGGSSCVNQCGAACLDGATCPFGGGTPTCQFEDEGWIPCCAYGSPIVIDAFGEGFHLTGLTKGVNFRVLPDEDPYRMSWTDKQWHNGWLALDRNGSGKIDDFTELFGNFTAQPPGNDPNGYAALAIFDDLMNGGNGDGAIDPQDSVYDHLWLWIDANHNGVSEPEELHNLRETGIFRIDLRYQLSSYTDAYGNRFRYKSRLWDEAGRAHHVCYDVFLTVEAHQSSGNR